MCLADVTMEVFMVNGGGGDGKTPMLHKNCYVMYRRSHNTV